MTNFTKQLAQIWYKSDCVAKKTGWWSVECMNQRTGGDIAREITALIWYTLLMYIYTVATIVLVIWGIYKIIVYRQQLRELSSQIERRQVQVQQQNKNVIVQSNKKPSIEHTSGTTTSCAMEMLTCPCTSAKRTVETCFICNEQWLGE